MSEILLRDKKGTCDNWKSIIREKCFMFLSFSNSQCLMIHWHLPNDEKINISERTKKKYISERTKMIWATK